MHALRSFHGVWGYVAIVANGLVGVAALIAWRYRKARGRWLWWATIAAESMMMIQVLIGVILVSSKEYTAPRFHMFYGFLAFLTVGLAYSYRRQMRGRRELFYGLVGLFIMGLGIRAVLQVTGS
jgi:heme A synthase